MKKYTELDKRIQMDNMKYCTYRLEDDMCGFTSFPSPAKCAFKTSGHCRYLKKIPSGAKE